MRFKTPLVFLALVILASAAMASVTGGDFDSLPSGPYTGAGDVLEGNPDNVQIRDVIDGTTQGAPLPPNASGKMLCIDAVNKTGRIVVEFTFSCDPAPSGVCQLKYDFGTAHWAAGGIEVHVDANGDYSNPDDVIDPPIGFPPSTSFGGNTENTGDCDGSTHTVAFLVNPGSIMYIDNLRTECIIATPTEKSTWGKVKSKYR